jgi:membrane protease YdiL (CAAX protease family)
MMTKLYRTLFLDHWERIDREAAEERRALANPEGFDARPVWVLIVVALVLVFQEYWGDRPSYDKLFGERLADWRYYTLGAFGWWAGAKVLGYLVVPLVLLLATRQSLSAYGLSIPDPKSTLRLYAVLFAAILPVIIGASFTRAFQATYPFYRQAARSWLDFFVWEGMYGATFLALEFFFRGFMLFSLRRAMGAHAIFVAIVPYCMIHFHKPVAEVVGAIFAGIVLGTVALATRSIWSGVLVHVSVGWTMDLLATAHVFGWPGSGRVP